MPYGEDEEGFIRDLTVALETQILAAYTQPGIDLAEVVEVLDQYSWRSATCVVE